MIFHKTTFFSLKHPKACQRQVMTFGEPARTGSPGSCSWIPLHHRWRVDLQPSDPVTIQQRIQCFGFGGKL